MGLWTNRYCLRDWTLRLPLLLSLHATLDRRSNLRTRICITDADGVPLRPDETESVQEFEE